MDATAFLYAIPIFMAAYYGLDFVLESRQKWQNDSRRRSNTSQKTLREFASIGSKLGFNKALLQSKKLRARLDLLLLRSGNLSGWSAEDLLFYKELAACLVGALLWWGDVSLWLCLLGPVGGFYLPDLYLNAKIKTRQADIQRRLPGLVDLLALTLESGLDLLAATERISEKMAKNPLQDELQMLLQESRLGTPRKEVMQHWAFRVNLPDVQALTSMIIQSEELGTSLANILRNYAEDMRNRRISRAEEIAGKAPVKLLFPMMVFFFPIVFVIIFGPLALNLMSSYK